MDDLGFALLCAKHAKSVAIALAADQALVGLGTGQMSCADSLTVALGKAAGRAAGAVLASDAPIPCAEVVERAAAAGVAAVIQPGGAEQEAAVVRAADRCGIAMVFTGASHIRH